MQAHAPAYPPANAYPPAAHPSAHPSSMPPAAYGAQGVAQGVVQSGLAPTGSLGLLPPEGNAIDPSSLRASGTGLWLTLAYVLLGLVTIATAGIPLLMLLLGFVADWIFRRRLRARVLGSCLRISPEQLPEVHQAASVIARRMGLTELPEIYVLETNTINAMAARIGGRKMVFLTDDAVDACLKSGDLRSLNFILAHELAHHALGHSGLLRSYLRLIVPNLSKLDEHSADAVATAIVGDRQVAAGALILLLTGPQLLPFVNRDAVIRQAMEVDGDRAAKNAERQMHHPLLLKRVARVYQG